MSVRILKQEEVDQKEPAAVKRLRRMFPHVDRVVEANKSVVFEVTRGDCRGGKKKSEDSCALARAVVRAGVYDGAIIRPSVAYLVRGDTAIRFMVPASVAREIVSFDRHKDFRPGEYQLSAVPPSRRNEALAKRRRDLEAGTWTGRRVERRAPLVSRTSSGMRGAKEGR